KVLYRLQPTSPSSWTATAAGPPAAAGRAPRGARRRKPRHPGAYALCLLQRQLAPLAGRSRGAAASARRIPAPRARPARPRRRALLGDRPPRSPAAASARRHCRHGGRHPRCRRAASALGHRLLQPRPDCRGRRRRSIPLDGGPCAPARVGGPPDRRRARSRLRPGGPAHPHRGRAAPLRFPAVGGGLRRALVHAHALAGLRLARAAPRPGGLRRPPAQVRSRGAGACAPVGSGAGMSRPLRVKFILPALTEATSPFFRPVKYSLFPPLGLATLAGYLDSGDYAELEDEHVARLRPVGHARFDLVVIQVYITNAYRAYALADAWRADGAFVVLGGLHVTALPEEAAPHADAIFLGPGEQTFPQFLAEFRARHRGKV